MDLVSHSERVWQQGPRGGVKLIKDRYLGDYGYITQNEEKMKEFAWIKLSAKNPA